MPHHEHHQELVRKAQPGALPRPAMSEAGFNKIPADLSAHEGLRCSADSKSMGKSQHHIHCTGLRSQETYAQAIQVVSREVTYVSS